MPASYRFAVFGRVQGVGFRYSAATAAQRLGLGGWVRNREDGAVEGLTSGSPEALLQFHRWLAQGPPAAQVESVEWVAAAEAAAMPFEVRR